MYYHSSSHRFRRGEIVLPLLSLERTRNFPYGNQGGNNVVYLSEIPIHPTIIERAWEENWFCYEVKPCPPVKESDAYKMEVTCPKARVVRCLGKTRFLFPREEDHIREYGSFLSSLVH